MLATVQEPHPSVLDAPTKNATLFYNSEAGPESKFTWVTDTGQPFLFIDEVDTKLTVTLENAVFAAAPITFLSNPDHFTILSSTPQELSIQINDVPLHYFNPWALSFNVDAGLAKGINSPPLLLVLPPSSSDSTSVNLQYSTANGSFTLDSVVVLASLDVLINNITPFDITFHLIVDDPSVSVTFNSLIGPSWLTSNLVSGTELKASILSNAGRFTSFQFVLNVGTEQVTSPDPILVNATIGDG